MLWTIFELIIVSIVSSEGPYSTPFPSNFMNIYITISIWFIICGCIGCNVACKKKFNGTCNVIYLSIFCLLSLIGNSLFMVSIVSFMVIENMIKPYGIYQSVYEWTVLENSKSVDYEYCCIEGICEDFKNGDCSSFFKYHESYYKYIMKDKKVDIGKGFSITLLFILFIIQILIVLTIMFHIYIDRKTSVISTSDVNNVVPIAANVNSFIECKKEQKESEETKEI